ncbi:hypothetical protein IC757_13755 [Wenzhouxiangella sp. AB-CW3]|uniref:DUF7489 domain-containing protein n=1 Tax=Wenzhouxiangella sp. AB-CW3 TaxID=2771012 RepID=UPI00168AB81D|nr:hypothetical protein [Wenzhouxiangella sp. AB-CW3]QOC22075.1 hypothetical protein IC757_13755 [Wenzhouxiangella sp. AB-CW3]
MATFDFHFDEDHPLYPLVKWVIIVLAIALVLGVVHQVGTGFWRFSQSYEGEVVAKETTANWLAFFRDPPDHENPGERERRRTNYWLKIETPDGDLQRVKVHSSMYRRVSEGDRISKDSWQLHPRQVGEAQNSDD